MHPEHDKLLMQATAAKDAEDWDLASDLWQQVYDLKPSHKASAFLGVSLEKVKNFDKARAIYSEALNRWPDARKFKLGYARASSAIEDWQAAEPHWADLVALDTDNPKWSISLANSQENLGKHEDLLKTLSQAKQRWPENNRIAELSNRAHFKFSKTEPISDLTSSILYNKNVSFGVGWHWLRKQAKQISEVEYNHLLDVFCETWKEKKQPLRHKAKRCIASGNFEEAIQIYKEMETFGTRRPSDVFLYALSLISLGYDDEAREKFFEYITVEDNKDEMLSGMGKFLVFANNFQAAKSILNDAVSTIKSNDGDDKSKIELELQPIFRFYNSIRPPLRPVTQNWDIDQEVIESAPSVSGDVFLIFTGYGGKFGPLPIEFMDRFLAGHGASLIKIADRSGYLFQNGIEQLAPNIDSTLDQLRKLLKNHRAQRIFTIGTSGGGFGALLYGANLGAEGVLLFSGPTNLTLDFLEKNNDFRARSIIRKINRDLSPEQLDMVSALSSIKHKPRIDAYFSKDNSGDRLQAENLVNLPNSHLHPLENTSTHVTIVTAFTRGHLQYEFERFMGVSTDAPRTEIG